MRSVRLDAAIHPITVVADILPDELETGGSIAGPTIAWQNVKFEVGGKKILDDVGGMVCFYFVCLCLCQQFNMPLHRRYQVVVFAPFLDHRAQGSKIIT